MATAGPPYAWASACAWVCACMHVQVHIDTHAHGHLKWPHAAGLHANPRTVNPGAGWVPAPRAGQSQLQLARSRPHISIRTYPYRFLTGHMPVLIRAFYMPPGPFVVRWRQRHTPSRGIMGGRHAASRPRRIYDRYTTPRHTRPPD